MYRYLLYTHHCSSTRIRKLIAILILQLKRGARSSELGASRSPACLRNAYCTICNTTSVKKRARSSELGASRSPACLRNAHCTICNMSSNSARVKKHASSKHLRMKRSLCRLSWGHDHPSYSLKKASVNLNLSLRTTYSGFKVKRVLSESETRFMMWCFAGSFLGYF